MPPERFHVSVGADRGGHDLRIHAAYPGVSDPLPIWAEKYMLIGTIRIP
jgi:hypothetical protein